MSNFIKNDKYDPGYNPEQSLNQYPETKNIDIKGFPYPLDRNDSRGFFYRAYNYEAIKSDLLQLLLTEPGERVMMPSFGTGLRKAMFEFNDQLSLNQIRELISLSIQRWEPRIVVYSIDVNFGTDDKRITVSGDNVDQSSIIISIDYALKEDLGNKESLEFRVNFNNMSA